MRFLDEASLVFAWLKLVDHVESDQIKFIFKLLFLSNALHFVKLSAVHAQDYLGHFLNLVQDVFETQLKQLGFICLENVKTHLEDAFPT